jgi:hypothetical protein
LERQSYDGTGTVSDDQAVADVFLNEFFNI